MPGLFGTNLVEFGPNLLTREDVVATLGGSGVCSAEFDHLVRLRSMVFVGPFFAD